MVVEKLGNSSLTDCIEDETCVDVNQLRKSCSLMARYICGDHPECTVRWHDVDYDNHEEKVRVGINCADKYIIFLFQLSSL